MAPKYSRNGKGHLYERDYSTGHSKLGILAPSPEKVFVEVKILKRQREEQQQQHRDDYVNEQQQQQRATVAAIAAAKELHQRQREREAEQALQRQLEEQERLLLQAKAQAARRLHSHQSLLDNQPQSNNFSFHDNDDDDDRDYGYTVSDVYHLTPHKQQQQQHHHHHHRYPVQNKEYTWRELRKDDKAYALSSPSRYAGRRKRSRQGKGDLLENDYHAGLSKSEILAMSSERKAAFECQKLRRQQHESSSPLLFA
ncbi:hypothetical protein BGZ97_001333 [Linnemannia gamsii]|uniref:Uncharacterized protein n=1 Tax=Linnemannia gamsii TaxID=64522 RepID=A0A9P6QXY8_9FUNG|nr:hypothetical protein BGZ97_001333 [Linnemannia gamsii]